MEVMKKTVEVYGLNDIYSLRAIDTLAVIWYEQGLWAMARSLIRHVIKISGRVKRKEHRETLEYLGQLAGVYERVWNCKKPLLPMIGRRRT